MLRFTFAFSAGHAALKETIEAAENAKVKRSMYAETQREKMEVLESIRNSEWNREMNPIVVTLQDQRPLEHDFSKGYGHYLLCFLDSC